MKNDKINLTLPIPRTEQITHVSGMLLSFLSAYEEFTEGRRKLAYLNFFYRERLNKRDKRLFSYLLRELIKQLETNLEPSGQQLNEALSQDEEMNDCFVDIFQKFQNF